MKHSTSLILCALALCFFATSSMSASDAKKVTLNQAVEKLSNVKFTSLVTSPKGVATTATMIALFIFFSRKPDTAPDRYDIEAVKADPSFQNILEFVYYYILDGVIGHQSQSSSAKMGEDGKTVVIKPGIPARGGLGYLSEIAKPLASTLGFIASISTFIDASADGINIWATALE